MVMAAACGVLRTVRNGRGLAMATLTGVYGVCMVLMALFPLDPVEDFPAGSQAGTVSTSGDLHPLFGAVGFVALAGAAFVRPVVHPSRREVPQPVRAGCGPVTPAGFDGSAAAGAVRGWDGVPVAGRVGRVVVAWGRGRHTCTPWCRTRC
jgi:hypothetical protein